MECSQCEQMGRGNSWFSSKGRSLAKLLVQLPGLPSWHLHLFLELLRISTKKQTVLTWAQSCCVHFQPNVSGPPQHGQQTQQIPLGREGEASDASPNGNKYDTCHNCLTVCILSLHKDNKTATWRCHFDIVAGFLFPTRALILPWLTLLLEMVQVPFVSLRSLQSIPWMFLMIPLSQGFDRTLLKAFVTIQNNRIKQYWTETRFAGPCPVTCSALYYPFHSWRFSGIYNWILWLTFPWLLNLVMPIGVVGALLDITRNVA